MTLLVLPHAQATITSPYGNRSANGLWRDHFHAGIDFGWYSVNRHVRSAGAGTIVRKLYTALRGYQVVIDHGRDWLGRLIETAYHMVSRLSFGLLRIGQRVRQLEEFAEQAPVKYDPKAAWTARHTHFEVRVDGAHTNPVAYIMQQPAIPDAALSGAEPVPIITTPEENDMIPSLVYYRRADGTYRTGLIGAGFAYWFENDNEQQAVTGLLLEQLRQTEAHKDIKQLPSKMVGEWTAHRAMEAASGSAAKVQQLAAGQAAILKAVASSSGVTAADVARALAPTLTAAIAGAVDDLAVEIDTEAVGDAVATRAQAVLVELLGGAAA